jgi:omega-6 fatty acid desaturase (delta-12 desaturase)
VWGFVVPYAVWNQLMGLTVLLQHTHPSMRWYRTAEEAGRIGGQERRSVHVRYPRWYGLLTHDIMEHPAHHVNPGIPFCNLSSAQLRLNEVAGAEAFVENVGLGYIARVVRCCKLYDYDRHAWLDFSGRESAGTRA